MDQSSQVEQMCFPWRVQSSKLRDYSGPQFVRLWKTQHDLCRTFTFNEHSPGVRGRRDCDYESDTRSWRRNHVCQPD